MITGNIVFCRSGSDNPRAIIKSEEENKKYILILYFLSMCTYKSFLDKLLEEIKKVEDSILPKSEYFEIYYNAGEMYFTKDCVFFESYGNDIGAENFEINLKEFKETLLSWKYFIEKKD